MDDVTVGWNVDSKPEILENEQIIWEGPADMFFVSHNLVIKIIMFFVKILRFIGGWRVTGHLILTNKRVIYSSSEYALWVLRIGSTKKIVFNHQIASFEYGFQASFLIFFKTKILTINSTGPGSDISLALKKLTETELGTLVARMIRTITK